MVHLRSTGIAVVSSLLLMLCQPASVAAFAVTGKVARLPMSASNYSNRKRERKSASVTWAKRETGEDGGVITSSSGSSRREILLAGLGLATGAAAVAGGGGSNAAWAIDVKGLKVDTGVDDEKSAAMKRIKAMGGEPPKDPGLQEREYDVLDSGVKMAEFVEGTGDAVVTNDSKVTVQMTCRLPTLQTQTQPGGLQFFSTKNLPDFQELTWRMGKGRALPGLEEGMIGMKVGSIRRIVVPSDQVRKPGYARAEDGLPSPVTKDEQRAYDRVITNPRMSADVLFEVLLERIK